MRATGRHRDVGPRHRLRRITMAGLFVAAASVYGVTWPGSAVADAPVQTGWWNAVSGGGQAAPSPVTPAGGLHLAVAPGHLLAYGAVRYALPKDSIATLELDVSNLTATPQINPSAPTTVPAANVQACPTKNLDWKAGDDQAWDSAPAYDCSLHSYTGSLSADSKTLTFLVDAAAEQAPGQLSLALVPVMTTDAPGVGTTLPTDATQPYSLDIAKPDVSSLTITGTLPTESGLGGSATTPTGTTTGSAGTAGATGTSSNAGGAGATAAGGSVAPMPNLPTGSGAATTAGEQAVPPVVAASTPAAPNAAPAAAVSSTGDDTAHNAALAMLILVGIAVIAASSGQMQRAPRLLGGAGRHAVSAAPAVAGAASGAVPQQAAGAGVAGPAAAVPAAYGHRGLGRFAKPRTAPPRPLI